MAPGQVKFELLFSGVCHTDVTIGGGAFGPPMFPFVPGHELLGKVTEIGDGVTKCKVGDIVGVGCMVDSCLNCDWCNDGEENYCDNGMIQTYNGEKKYGRVLGNKHVKTWGGYSASNVVHEHFVLNIPAGLPLDKAAPILCAGVTMYDPLRHWGFVDSKPRIVGIVGVGGLGTMGIKIAKALGHTVVAISTSPNKAAIAKERGAHHFVVSTDEKTFEGVPKCDIILNTVSADHDLNVYLKLLAKSGQLVQMGIALKPHPVT